MFFLRLNDRNDGAAVAWVGPFNTQEEAGDYTNHSADDYVVVDAHNQPDPEVAKEVADSYGIGSGAFPYWMQVIFPPLEVAARAEAPQ